MSSSAKLASQQPALSSSPHADEQLAFIPQRENLRSLILRTTRSAGVVLILLSLIIVWLNSTGLSTGLLLGDMSLKPPSSDDRLKAEMAASRKETKLCGEISSQASVVRPFQRDGRQAAFFQSECYFDLAVATRDDLACVNVRPILSSWLDGSALTPERCMTAVRLTGARNRPAAARGAAGLATQPESAANAPVDALASAQPAAAAGYATAAGQADGMRFYRARNEQASDPEIVDAETPDAKQQTQLSQDSQQSEQKKYQDAWDDWKRNKDATRYRKPF